MHRLRGGKRKPDRTGVIAGGEEVHEVHSLLPHVVAGCNREEGDRANADGRQVRSTDRPPHPDESVPVEASRSNQQGGEVSQEYSHPHSGVGVELAEGSGPIRERNDGNREKVERVYPSLSTSSIPRSGEPGSMWTRLH